MPEQGEACTLDALLIGEEGACLLLAVGEFVLLVEQAAILEIDEVKRETEAGAAAPVRVTFSCSGSIRRIEPAPPPLYRSAGDPFAVCSRALWAPPEARGARSASPAYRALVERFLEERGLTSKVPQ